LETQRPPRTGLTLAAVVVAALFVGAAALFLYSTESQQSVALNNQVRSLQGEVSALQSTISILQAQVSGQGASGASLPNSSAQALYAAASPSVVTLQGELVTTVNTFFGPVKQYSTVIGSGFVTTYGNATYVVTNYHVVAGVSNESVTFQDGNAYPATLVGVDPYSDLAVVKTSAPSGEFKPITIDNSASLVVGQPVFVIGNPYGLTGSFTTGVISQLDRTIQETAAGNYSIAGVIQFSAPINPGNSGGPLLDSTGDVMGITTAVVSGSQGVGFAIPSQTIMKELPSLVANGEYPGHSYLGIGATDMTYALAQATGASTTYGVLVEQVVSGSPAAQAGLKAGTTQMTVDGSRYLVGGDIIVSIDGHRIINQDALSSYLALNTTSGQTVTLGVVRSGSQIGVPVTLGARP
jgi:S1-C subfamily serine protease